MCVEKKKALTEEAKDKLVGGCESPEWVVSFMLPEKLSLQVHLRKFCLSWATIQTYGKK